MKNLLQILGAVLIVVLIVFGSIGIVLGIKAIPLIKDSRTTVQAIGTAAKNGGDFIDAANKPETGLLASANNLLARIDAYAEVTNFKLNGDQGSPAHPHSGPNDGILGKVYKDLKDLHQIEHDANTEQKDFWIAVNQERVVVFPKLNLSIDKVNDNLDDLDKSLKKIPGLVEALTTAVNSANQTIKDADKQLNDPQIHDALVDLAATSKNTREFTEKLAATMELIRGKIDAAVHPSKKKQILTGLLNALRVLYYVSVIKW